MSSKLGTALSVVIAALLGGTPASTLSADTKAAAPGSVCSGPMPSALAAPDGNGLAFEARADGVQIYSCASSSGAAGPAWTLQAPEATLVDEQGQRVGSHAAGPTWEALDGSSVVGAKVEAATPDPAAIPWLLLRAASHGTGRGRMAEVTFVQRVRTSGGLAPSEGCSATTLGTVVRVPYRAVYCFYRNGNRRAEGSPAPSYGSAAR
jgi:hypothetical protein